MHMLPLLLLVAIGQTSDERMAALVEAGNAAKELRVKQMAAGIASVGRVTRKGETRAQRAARIRQLREEYEAFKASKDFYAPALEFPLKTGSIGRLQSPSVKVLQVVGPTEMLGYVFWSYNPVVIGNRAITREPNRVLVWFLGIDTAGVADDSAQQMTAVYEVTGTKSYSTAAGASSTVFVLRPFDRKVLDEYLKTRKAR